MHLLLKSPVWQSAGCLGPYSFWVAMLQALPVLWGRMEDIWWDSVSGLPRWETDTFRPKGHVLRPCYSLGALWGMMEPLEVGPCRRKSAPWLWWAQTPFRVGSHLNVLLIAIGPVATGPHEFHTESPVITSHFSSKVITLYLIPTTESWLAYFLLAKWLIFWVLSFWAEQSLRST